MDSVSSLSTASTVALDFTFASTHTVDTGINWLYNNGMVKNKEQTMIEQGTICVLRKTWIDGSCELLVMPLADQKSYKEWTGCFSYWSAQ